MLHAQNISVVIPNLNSPLIDQVLDALRAQTTPPREVLVVGLDQPGLVREDGLVRLIATGRRISPAAARNLGASLAVGDYLLFIDADCIAAPDLVERMVERHRQGCAIVGGGVAVEPGGYWTLCDNLIAFAPTLSVMPPGARSYLPSLNLSIARSLFQSVGGFDTAFPLAAGEDLDLSLRLRRQGHTLYFEPRAIVHHHHRRDSARAIWDHLRDFGRIYAGVQRRYSDMIGSRLNQRLAPWGGAIMAAAPLLALWNAIGIFRLAPTLPRYWYALPGMTWGKIAWYWGVAEALIVLGDQ